MIVATAVLATPTLAQSQTQDERDVIAVAQKLFDTMASCDAAAARAISMPEGRLYRLVTGAEPAVRSTTLEEFTASLAKCGRKMLERMWQPQVRVHKGIATLWAPYDFWLDGAFSHCGIDSFEFVKTAEGWELTGGTYTVEREGCAPEPPRAPGGETGGPMTLFRYLGLTLLCGMFAGESLLVAGSRQDPPSAVRCDAVLTKEKASAIVGDGYAGPAVSEPRPGFTSCDWQGSDSNFGFTFASLKALADDTRMADAEFEFDVSAVEDDTRKRELLPGIGIKAATVALETAPRLSPCSVPTASRV